MSVSLRTRAVATRRAPTTRACGRTVCRRVSRVSPVSPPPSFFSGPSSLHSTSGFVTSSFCGEEVAQGVSNGGTTMAIRHGRRVAKLGRPADQRKALLRSLTTELLRHGRIKTHMNRAKAMRKHVDHIITLAKRGDEHAKFQAKKYCFDDELIDSVFEEVPSRYESREGGYTRIFHTVPRRGDNTEMAVIELV